MVQLSGLAAHKKPRIWAWQPSKSLDYKISFAFICQNFLSLDKGFKFKPASNDPA